ncbi:Hypothetical protein IALB_2069 [Ignavibacterium album JCM 16511]|uniref:Uncharacterized protein n=1 Tax=Ignavibacterium album (strain DSM 19864 / JCM 16511 / NBRC 101810 / Mat9-16) TaxID=945713 RepID=I0ALB7_IGNAJ|nr:hypothetical protein [Ignavibacterium album]AFH49774.1 Hypothetical protein IALB_2069 [Ignavibacterium album JCM 16511]
MKKLILVSVILFFNLQGCYTVIMTPEDKTPVYNDYYGFYLSEYYGSYGSYYEVPWWITNPIVTINSSTTKNRTTETHSIRNNDGFKHESGSRDGIITTPPPSRDNSSSTTTQKSGSSSVNEVRSNTSSGNSPGNSNSGSIRNENGNRNSGNSRR